MSPVESLGGALGKEQLFSLLGYLKNTRATGKLFLQSGSRSGAIYLRGGEVVHAMVGDLSGEQAVTHMVTWNEGQFSFRSGERSTMETIADSLESLALAVAVAIDHGAVQEPSLTNVDLELAARVKPQPANMQIMLEGHELALLARINPNSPLERSGQELGWSHDQLRGVVVSLLSRGMIELIEPARRPSVNPAFIGALRQAFAQVLGPAAEFLFEDVASSLQVDTMSLRPERFSDFLRGLADAIDDPTARARFIERIKALRNQFGI